MRLLVEFIVQAGGCYVLSLAALALIALIRRKLMPDLESFWFWILAAQVLLSIAFVPNGPSWIWGLNRIDLRLAEDGEQLTAYGVLLLYNVLGVLVGLGCWQALVRFSTTRHALAAPGRRHG
ncbi:MAG: hypothetical protein GAK45_01613 [Pseudomonas citronellolis]|nr:MAG: hypothetical protein GAK45_01613 [Pseudomonas citronellolis]